MWRILETQQNRKKKKKKGEVVQTFSRNWENLIHSQTFDNMGSLQTAKIKLFVNAQSKQKTSATPGLVSKKVSACIWMQNENLAAKW